MSTRRIDYMPIGELEVAHRNPKKHAASAITDSIDRFGYVEPIVIDERTGRLVAGHGRIESLRASNTAGSHPPDGVTVMNGVWTVPVVRGWSSKDDREADAYLIASNRLVEAGGWDDAMLAELLDGLGPDLLTTTGFDADDLDDLHFRLLGHVGLETEGQTPKEAKAGFDEAGIRSIILPYAALDAEALSKSMTVLRSRFGMDTNSALVKYLVEQEEARDAPHS